MNGDLIPFDIEPELTGYEQAGIVFVPVPYDKSSTWGKGADTGPEALIKASSQVELYDIQTSSEVYQRGMYLTEEINAESGDTLTELLTGKVKDFLDDDKFVVTLGGEHTAAVGAALAHNRHYTEMSVLHLDAHSDRRSVYQGDTYNHACTIARIKEAGIPVVSAGIRSMDGSELISVNEDTVVYAHDFVHDPAGCIDRVVNGLTDNVYVTVDLDVFDPAYVPATGTPEPGGLNWYHITDLLRKVALKRCIVGFDICELCPDSTSRASEFLAAKLVYVFLSMVFYNR